MMPLLPSIRYPSILLQATVSLVFLLLLGGCLSKPVQDTAPATEPAHLARLPDPVPRQEPRSASGNKSPYEVFGKSYRVLPSSDGYIATGKASWYGTKFHGRKTSSGEPYDMYQLTAAHRNLPIPSYVRVTNLANNRSTVVRVNDRGPFHSERIIDLSYAAAVKLGFAHRGTTQVKVEALVPGHHVQHVRNTAPAPVVAAAKQIYLQAGAYAEPEGAARLSTELRQLIGNLVQVVRLPADDLYRVRIGPLPHVREATRLQALILTANYGMPMIIQQ